MSDTLYQYAVKVNRVVDGDTLDVDIDLGFNVKLSGKRLRIKGVDCPERNTIEGSNAKSFTVLWTISQMNNNKPILVSVESHKGDKYGRILASVWSDGQDLAQQLILAGHGVPYSGGKKVDTGTMTTPPQGEC